MGNVPREALPTVEELTANDSVPWYLKYAARILATIASILCITLGILSFFLSAVTLAGWDIPASIFEVLIGVIVILIEAPFLCKFFPYAQIPGEFLAKNKHPFTKAALYIILSIIPVIMSRSPWILGGCVALFLVGIIQTVIAFGRKAPREDMQAAAGGQPGVAINMQRNPSVY